MRAIEITVAPVNGKVKMYPKGNRKSQKTMMSESVSGSSQVLVNGKVPRANKKHATKNVTKNMEVKIKASYSAHPSKIPCAKTYEQIMEENRIRAERKARRMAKA